MSGSGAARLRLFGGPALEVEGEEVGLSPYQAALLALLAWPSEPVPRPRALRLLWDEGDEEARRHRLAQLVYSLNRKVDVPLLETDAAGRLTLRSGVESDTDELRERLAGEEWRNVERLLRREFAPAAAPVSDAFEDWLDEARRDVRTQAILRASEAARTAVRALAWERVAACASLLLSLDATDREAVHWRVAAAARVPGSPEPPELLRRLTVQARRVEESWTPDGETSALVEAWSGRRPRTLRDPADLPLVGRESLLARCQEVLEPEGRDGGRVLALVGEPGIGKTRILDTLVHERRLAGTPVLRGRASELARHFPLSTLEDALEPDHLRRVRRLENPWRKVLSRFLLRDEEDPDSLASFRASLGLPLRQLQEAFLVLFQELAGGGPITVVVDDFQWSDASSTVILDHVLRKWSGEPLDLIVALRTGPDAEFSPGGQMISALPDHVTYEAAHVEELGPADAELLVRRFLSRQGESAAQARIPEILELAGGNPFFLIEVARHGLLKEDVRPSRSEDDDLPPRILEFIQSVVGRLPALARSVLTAAAASQEELGVDDLVEILGLAPHELFPAIDHLVERGLLESVGTSTRIRHDIVRDAVYRRLPAIERTWIHGRLAAAFDASDSGSPGRVALHAWKGGQSELAHGRALEAASEAETKGATPEAMEFLRIALDTTSDPAEEMEIEIRMANLAYRDRALETAEPALRHAVTRWKGSEGGARIRSLEARWTDVRELLGDLPLDRATESLEKLKHEARRNEDWDSLSEILELHGVMLERRGRIAELPPILSEAREITHKCSLEGKVRCLRLLAFEGLIGDPKKGRSAVLKGLKMSENQRLGEEWLATLKRALILATFQGEIETSLGLDLRRKAEKAASETADWHLQYSFWNGLGLASLEAMQLGQAEYFFRKALQRLEGTTNSEAIVVVHGNLAEVHFWRREYEVALELFEKARDAVDDATPLQFQMIVEAGAGLCHLKLGNLDKARAYQVPTDTLPTKISTDLTMVFILEAEQLRRQGKLARGVESLLGWSNRVKETFFTTHLKLILYANMIGSGPEPQRYVAEALEEAEKRALTRWTDLFTGAEVRYPQR